jgi:hypothetical protein
MSFAENSDFELPDEAQAVRKRIMIRPRIFFIMSIVEVGVVLRRS